MELGLLIAAIPAVLGGCVIECWRRETVRAWERAQHRHERRSRAWAEVGELGRIPGS